MNENKNDACPRCGAPHAGPPDEPCAACLLRLALDSDEATTVGSTPGEDASAGEGAEIPTAVGDWRPIRRLGEGGMGVVYLAEELGPLKRQGALKRIKHGLDSTRVLERFDQERRVLARMDHPCIARAIDAGSDESGAPFFVMEYVPGAAITDYCDARRLGTRERLSLFARLCDAVDHAHRRGILHRDLKPSNILVHDGPDGPQPKVIDFGVARAIAQRRLEWSVFTEFGRLVGTPEYMSPEQADLDNDDLDTRSDVYGLGVILYELLVGKTPHDACSLRGLGLQALLRTIRESTFPTPSSRLSTLGDEVGAIAERRGSDPDRLRRGIAGELDWIVMRATERDRERRYGSPRELGEDIERYLASLPVLAGPPSTSYRVRKFIRRHRVGVAVVAAVALALIAGVAGLGWGLKRALAAEASAREEQLRAQTTTEFIVGLFDSVAPDDEPILELSAVEALDRGVERMRDAFPDDPLMRATILQELGAAYENIQLFDRALPLLEESLQLRETHMSPLDPDLAEAHFMVGFVLAEGGRHRDAIPYYERAIDLLDATDRDPPGAIARPLGRLGEAWRAIGDYDAAVPPLERAVEAARADPGPDSPLYAMALNTLGATLLYKGALEESEAAYVEGISVLESTSPNGVDIARMKMNLSTIRVVQRRFDEAEQMVRRAIEIFSHVYGEDEPQTATAWISLVSVLRETGRQQEAAEILERVLPVLEAAYGPSYPWVVSARVQLASAYEATGRLEHAIGVLERQLEALDGDTDRMNLGVTYHQLGRVLNALKRWDPAIVAFEQAERLLTSHLGEGHPKVAGLICSQANGLRFLGRLDEARARLDRALAILRADDLDQAADRHDLSLCLEGLARVHADGGDHESAITAFEESIEIAIEVGADEDATLAELHEAYARSLRAVGRDDDADTAESRASH